MPTSNEFIKSADTILTVPIVSQTVIAFENAIKYVEAAVILFIIVKIFKK